MKKIAALILTLCFVLGAALPAFSMDTATAYTFKDYIDAWKGVNSDVDGWLYIEGTNINYPVIFYGADTNYYIDKDYYKMPSKNGCIYAEAQVKTGKLEDMSLNTVLYGHNWTNYSANPRIGNAGDIMFAQLPSFHYLDFAANNQFINYSNSNGAYVFQVFAVFYTEVSFVYYNGNPTKEEFSAIMSGVRARSIHNYDVNVEYGDRIITLSTCTRAFGPSSQQRFVVMGKMVPYGTEKVAVTANPNYQRPSL